MAIASLHMLNQRQLTVEQIVRSWPSARPLAMTHSAGRHDRWGRWSVLCSPQKFETFTASSDNVLTWLEQLLSTPAAGVSQEQQSPELPFTCGWIGYFSYELGQLLEPTARSKASPSRSDGDWPLIALGYCPAALLFDHTQGRWHAVGDADAARELVEQLDFAACDDKGSWHCGEIVCEGSADAHLAAVTRTLQYIAAGDIFQANITQQFRTTFSGCTRALANHALSRSGARYGAYIELPAGKCIVSMSPELFLDVNAATRRVTTRPIKGTLPQQSDPEELAASTKDAAELHMITDLMRNDLGRVCEFGSIRVEQSRTIETHPTVHHGVSTIVGTLRADVRLPQLLAATFPPGSITGAPKIRAMQIIDELEQHPRGPYCGAIGTISHCGNIALNVAIRTMLLHGRRTSDHATLLDAVLTYGAGGGIVADSQPLSEYRECMDKAAVLRLALRGAGEAATTTSPK